MKRNTLVNALRVAADRYESDARMYRSEPAVGLTRLAAQFARQAIEARDAADVIEQVETIRLED